MLRLYLKVKWRYYLKVELKSAFSIQFAVDFISSGPAFRIQMEVNVGQKGVTKYVCTKSLGALCMCVSLQPVDLLDILFNRRRKMI